MRYRPSPPGLFTGSIFLISRSTSGSPALLFCPSRFFVHATWVCVLAGLLYTSFQFSTSTHAPVDQFHLSTRLCTWMMPLPTTLSLPSLTLPCILKFSLVRRLILLSGSIIPSFITAPVAGSILIKSCGLRVLLKSLFASEGLVNSITGAVLS